MASVRDYIRINPLDTDNRRAVGVRFPFNAEGVFFSTFTTAEQVKSNLINLLLTKQGERIGEVNFGVGLQNLLFEQNIDLENLKEKIKTQINIYIPQISLLDAQTNFIENEQTLYIVISYRFNLDGTQDTIQLNFE